MSIKNMKSCPKCNSTNLKKHSAFARRKGEGMKFQTQSNQMVNYQCLDCENTWEIKFSEDSD